MHQSGIQEMTLEEVMGDRFARYSKYIIQERALPDIRDGLKPVQRRILFAMNEDGNTYDKGFRKSAKSVGNIMGNYHPHGDSSIYEAMVRMSQDWKVRHPLIEMHGNNGSMDGDPPAAMRYTEARLSALSGELLADIQKETVDMVWNFDDTAKEPTVLPANFPNLLVNGATGISAGYATEIPTHNLGEVIDGAIYVLDHPQATVEDLMSFIPGPDFPTGGILMGKQQLKKAYETGKGKVVLRAKTAIETLRGGREQIVITEIPYELNKANLVKKMDEIRINKKIDGIAEVRDETDRNGLRIVVELKKNANSEGVLNYFFKNTDLQINYNFNMVAIDHLRPVQVGLKRMLEAYLEHRRDVILRRSRYDLEKAQKRAHIVSGLIKALSILDQIIATIRQSQNRAQAKQNIMDAYDFTDLQAEAIVTMPLYRLTNTDVTALQKEAEQLQETVSSLMDILENERTLVKVMKKELRRLKKDYATERKTEICDEVQELRIEEEVLIASEQTMVAVTKHGYMKRSSLRSVQSSGGKTECGIREDDEIVFMQELNTRHYLYLLTNKGNMIYRPVHEIQEWKWKEVGDHITQFITNLSSDEVITAVFAFDKLPEEETLLMVTKEGITKQTKWQAYRPWRTYRTKAMMAMKLKTDTDEIVLYASLNLQDSSPIVMFTKLGYALRFSIADISLVGAKAAGVKAMNLKEDDEIVTALIAPDSEDYAVIVTQRGSAKLLSLDEIPMQNRAQRGVQVLRPLKTKPHHLIFAAIADEHERLMITTQKGTEVTVPVVDIPKAPRESNGGFIIDEKAEHGIYNIKMNRNEEE